jgi:hypothetical protein
LFTSTDSEAVDALVAHSVLVHVLALEPDSTTPFSLPDSVFTSPPLAKGDLGGWPSGEREKEREEVSAAAEELATAWLAEWHGRRAGLDGDEAAEPVDKEAAERTDRAVRRFLSCPSTAARFVVARGSVAAALVALRETTTYFVTTGTFDLRSAATLPSMDVEGATGKCYRHGRDKEGRPVMYLRDARQNTKDARSQIAFTKFTLEGAIASMDEAAGVYQWVLLFDFKGRSLANTPSPSTTREILDCFQSYYPERLHTAYMLDAPWIFWAFWRMISPFIDKKTAQKIVFVTSPDCDAILEHIDADVLEEDFGGKASSTYDHDRYWAAEQANVAAEEAWRSAAAAAKGGGGARRKTKTKTKRR